jgi:transcriptional regulator with XRE-family HTH domain
VAGPRSDTNGIDAPFTRDDLRARRAALGLTQARLGTLLGRAPNTIARWERGERPISSPELVRLALERLGSVSSGDGDTPATRALADDTRLPVPLTSFIGRRDELHPLRQMLGAIRLLTLLGPAGLGKTRLALEAVRAHAAHTREHAGLSKSEVSRLCAVLDDQAEIFRTRPLDAVYPYLWLDARMST